VFGNVGFIDCGTIFNDFLESTKYQIDCAWFNTTEDCNKVLNALDRIDNYITDNNIEMCNFAFEVDGCLQDQASYYVDRFSVITQKVSKRGNEIMQALTQ